MTVEIKKLILRRLSKLTCGATVFLIFAGGLVTSTGSGLAVPDWPLSYGMVFPPMVGGVFYEHGHRMVATVVGFLTLLLAILTASFEKRRWVKNLSYVALAAVIIQGILGGITVKFFLPLWVSVSHGILAQTFLCILVILAYSFSLEHQTRFNENFKSDHNSLKTSLVLIYFIYMQLLFGAIMRHTHSGLAIPDFPTMGGEWWPKFDQTMLNTINANRFDLNLAPVDLGNVLIHFVHRFMAVILVCILLVLNAVFKKITVQNIQVRKTLNILNMLFILQIGLGITTVLTHKEYRLTSLHVVTGAIILAWTVLLFLRAAPVQIRPLKNILLNRLP